MRREAKRQAKSPLESENLRRKMEYQTDWGGDTSKWISVEKKLTTTQNKPPTRNRQQRAAHRSKEDNPTGHTTGNVSTNRESKSIEASLRNLEALHESMDKRIQAGHAELDTKMDKILSEQRDRFERLELAQHEQELRWGKYQEDKHHQDERVAMLENHLKDMRIGEMKDKIQDLTLQIENLERQVGEAKGSEGLSDEMKRVMYMMIRKIVYLESRLDKHERQLLDVNADLKDKFMCINGLFEEQGENLLEKVLKNINGMFRAALQDPPFIQRDEIDMVYRTGKMNAKQNFPRSITVIFMRRGLKQWIMSAKKSLGWNANNKITYSDDMSYEVRTHREKLKAIASRAQKGEHTVKMAGNRIFIDGTSYGYEEMDIIPSDLRRAIPQMKYLKDGIAFKGKDCFLSNFFACEIKIEDEIYSSVEQFYQHMKCVTCEEFDRARKIMSSEDPLYAKVIGDNCPPNEEWIENRVLVMFKGIFYKFSQNEELVLKLLSTGKTELLEATTDRFFGTGIGFQSKKWEQNEWFGKNVTGRLLVKVRHILKKKMDEGYVLEKLVFNYSMPSLKSEANRRHWDLFLARDDEQPMDCQQESEVVADDSVRQELQESPIERFSAEIDKELGELTQLILADEKNKSDSSSLLTLCQSWVAKKKSHSTLNPASGVKSRRNPERGLDSLTFRERAYIRHAEEDDLGESLSKLRGFERAYGHTRKDVPHKTSTPMNSCKEKMSDRAKRALIEYLDTGKFDGEEISNYPENANGSMKTKTRPDTPIPPEQPTKTDGVK